MARLETGTTGSRLAIVITAVIVTAVVVAGGVALATVARNSVGSREIINGSIRSVDIGNGQVRAPDIATNAVRGSDIKNGAVSSVDIGDGQVKSVDIGDGQVQGVDIASSVLGGGSNAVSFHGFEVRMAFGSSITIAENGPIRLSLRCRQSTDPEAIDGRDSLIIRAFATAPYLTTKQDATGPYSANTGVSIEAALGSSTPGTPVQTSFIERMSGAAAITGLDGRQISLNGEGTQVAFNVNGDDCYARGVVAMLPPR